MPQPERAGPADRDDPSDRDDLGDSPFVLIVEDDPTFAGILLDLAGIPLMVLTVWMMAALVG